MKRTTGHAQRAAIHSRIIPALLLLGAGLYFFSGNPLWAQDCVNCTRGEIEPGGTFSNNFSMDEDCRHTGGAGPPYDIIRYEQGEPGCVTFSAVSSCNTMLELLDRNGCLSFIQNDDCPAWEDELLENSRNSCLSLRLCPGIYYICVYPMRPCEGWPDTRTWDYSVRVTECREEPELPANDNCGNAIEVGMNTSVTGTTLQAACDDVPACSGEPRSGMVWYRFTGTGSEVELNACERSTAIQARIAVYTGSCGDLVCVDAERIGCLRDRETVLVATGRGEQYHVAVYGAGDPDIDSWLGEFELIISGTPAGGRLLPGDFNADSRVNISDPIAVLEFLFIGGRRIACPDEAGIFTDASLAVADFNGDERLDISDGVSMLNWLFLGGPSHHLGLPSECRVFEGCSEEEACVPP